METLKRYPFSETKEEFIVFLRNPERVHFVGM